jgi:serine protease Do
MLRPMEFVDPDDERPFRKPPSRDDRVWRHPSEVGVEGPVAKMISQGKAVALVVVAAVGASVLTAAFVVTVDLVRDEGPAASHTVVTRASAVAPIAPAEPAVEIGERVRPAIVQIRTERPGADVSGSGVFLRSDGHLVTNAHVLEGAGSVSVVLASGRELPGRVVGTDPVTDSAVLKVEGGPFPVADLGTAAELKVGQMAVAMGSPLALAGGPSVTQGVISALHRTVRTRDGKAMYDMIQTDAPISPGSSGGALLDRHGRVIGITTAMAVTDSGPEGLGFATPIDIARSVADQIIATGRATHAWLGVEGSDVDGATAHDLNLDGGAMLNRVLEGGPAQSAGLSPRDVVVSVDGQAVVSMGSLVAVLRAHRPGDVIRIEVVRDRQRTTRSVTLAERPANP